MKLKDYLDNPFEIFWGACAQFPIILIINWWAIPVMVLCGLLWRAGGVIGGNKLFRKVGVPLVLCFATFLHRHHFGIFLAVPFMIWACPWSYGRESWLFKFFYNPSGDEENANLDTRFVLFLWYWAMYRLALNIPF